MKSQARRVTREDVALRAGVSTATVSYVINNGPRPVAASTRQRVLSTIAELGYYPNELARSLRVKQSLTVGLVIPDLMNPFYTGLAHSLEDICFGRGYVLILCSTNREADKERRFAELLRAKQVDGVVFLPDSKSMDAVTILRQAHVPVVILEHDIAGLACIAIDDFRGGYLATQHLIDLGHRRIGFIQQEPNYTTSRRRLDGYHAALRENNIEINPALVVACHSGHSGGASALTTLLARNPDMTAVFAHNDVIAMGVIHAIGQAGLSVPGDISVVGNDDIASAAYYAPPLTTISYPKEAMATAAARQLFATIDTREEPGAPITELLPVRLIARQSTAPVHRKEN